MSKLGGIDEACVRVACGRPSRSEHPVLEGAHLRRGPHQTSLSRKPGKEAGVAGEAAAEAGSSQECRAWARLLGVWSLSGKQHEEC